MRGVHGLGDAEPVAEQVPPKPQSGFPVDSRRRTWDVLAAWVGDDVRSRKCNPALERLRMLGPGARLAKIDLTPAAAGLR